MDYWCFYDDAHTALLSVYCMYSMYSMSVRVVVVILLLTFLSAFLTTSQHFVSLSNDCSAFAPVHSGDPPGSIHGPILITMHIKTLSAIVDAHPIIHQ